MWEAVLWQRMTAAATLGAALGIERQTIPAAVIHLAGEPFGEDRARAQNANNNPNIEQRVKHGPFARNQNHL